MAADAVMPPDDPEEGNDAAAAAGGIELTLTLDGQPFSDALFYLDYRGTSTAGSGWVREDTADPDETDDDGHYYLNIGAGQTAQFIVLGGPDNKWSEAASVTASGTPARGPEGFTAVAGSDGTSFTASWAGNRGRRITLAHELCHLLFDRLTMLSFSRFEGGGADGGRLIEMRANAFAVELLVPMANRVKDGSIVRAEEALRFLSFKYGVIETAIKRHVQNLDTRLTKR